MARVAQLLSLALLLCLPSEASSFNAVVCSGRAAAPRSGIAGSTAALAMPLVQPARLPSQAMRPHARASAPVMLAKKVSTIIKLALDAGSANPAPPVGPALGAAGVNIMMFCKEYNARTQDQKGTVIPVEISVYEDRSFTFILKTPPAAELLKKAAKVKKGHGEPAVRNKAGVLTYNKAGEVTMAQIEEIAKIKMPDLNTNKLQSAMNTVMGTAKNMGIHVKDA